MTSEPTKQQTTEFRTAKDRLVELIRSKNDKSLAAALAIIAGLPECDENIGFVRGLLKHLKNV